MDHSRLFEFFPRCKCSARAVLGHGLYHMVRPPSPPPAPVLSSLGGEVKRPTPRLRQLSPSSSNRHSSISTHKAQNPHLIALAPLNHFLFIYRAPHLPLYTRPPRWSEDLSSISTQ
ncbi:hypothetical protein BDN67DRAFT_131055 [Paxillus ammoniavirescens]|nr:hypothetical protein BDN67DRAFT_131055 [Paxillus ammoniavirescens]